MLKNNTALIKKLEISYIIEFVLPNHLYYSKSKLDTMPALDLMANANQLCYGGLKVCGMKNT